MAAAAVMNGNASSGDWEGRYYHVDQILERPGPRTDPSFLAGDEVKDFLRNKCKILVIGAGGLGCEILANLALSGFKDIHVIDMDTIDISNLNRQFLFRQKDVGNSKANVAAEFIMNRVPGVKVTPYFGKIQDKDEDYYMQFNLVICGLDSENPESLKPLIDGGTEGFKVAVYYLLKNPDTMRKLRDEIDSVMGSRPFTTADMNCMPYLIAVMRETLRLAPTAPARTVAPFEDTIIGGKYFVAKDASITVDTFDCQRDREVWGPDAEEFKPERMLDGKFEALPSNAWQAFGFGMRACIGGAFAWQEAQIALVTIFQHFDLVMNDPTYELQMKQTLSIKPKDFFIRAVPRKTSPHQFVPRSINVSKKA